ncbi:sigma factor G inhibitor Gin [Bacillota bacterium LX-D]|nr:sigma factor G inhibitor Gin [Bacillota bacterium LX-D]
MTEASNLLPRCIICDSVPNDGIIGGVVIKGIFICHQCSLELTNLETTDDKYALYMGKLKKLWQ